MHEYSIVQALLAQVEQEATTRGATAVRKLHVRIGELSGVSADLLITAYETLRNRSVCAGAGLEVARVPARWICAECGEEIERGGVLRCVECDAPGQLAGGDEILLDRIEMEVADV